MLSDKISNFAPYYVLTCSIAHTQMKKILSIWLLLLLCIAANAQSSRRLRVYQQGGSVDTLTMTNGSTIAHSRLDLNGQQHPDYVSLIVTTSNLQHQYLIANLDSLVLPNGHTVVFRGRTADLPLLQEGAGGRLHSSFSGTFPGGSGVTYYWTENDHIRLDVGYESRAKNLSAGNTQADFLFEDADLDADAYTVYYPDKQVTILSHQTQTGANNTEHIGPSGDCGVATATRDDTPPSGGDGGGSYSFSLQHKAAYLCFLPHIDHLPSAKVTRIELYCEKPIAGTYALGKNSLYNGSNTSYTISLDLVPQQESDFFIGHDKMAEQDSVAAYMVIAPQDASRSFTVTYYVTDTLSRISKTYRQQLSFQPVANRVYPITFNISDADFHAIDLGLSCNWSNVNAGADDPSKSGPAYASDAEANAALLEQTVVTEWLMPDEDQQQEILEKCTWTRGTYGGVSGYFVEGAAASLGDGIIHRIFIPCAEGKTKEQCIAESYRPVETLMVDLGLPHGVKWASRNIGANSVEDYGDYFAWGEVEPKREYSSSTYQYGTQNLGDNYDISGTQNDVAVMNWGGLWRMPTQAEMADLVNNCTWNWSPINGVNGYIITGTTGNKIFLPASGYMDGTTLKLRNSGGVYMTSIQGGNNSGYAYTLGFTSSLRSIMNAALYDMIFGHNNPFAERRIGHCVRAVTAPNASTADGVVFNIRTDSTTWKLGDTRADLYGTISSSSPFNGTVTVGFVIGDSATIDVHTARFTLRTEKTVLGSYMLSQDVYDNIGYWYRAFIETPDTIFYGNARHYGYGMIDLGLASGTLWANMNIGADVPSDYGNHYAWGENEPKEDYSLATYQWYQNSRYYNLGEDFDIAGTEQDVAHVKMGNAWRTPTYVQMKELVDSCTWQWTSQDNVSGYTVRGKNGNSIFLPAAGYYEGTQLQQSNSGGTYQTSTQGGNNSRFAYTLGFTSSERSIMKESLYTMIFGHNNIFAERRVGHTVRAVAMPNGSGKDGVVLNVITDSATWKWNNASVVLHGTLSSTTPIEDEVTVGFIIGMNDSITVANAIGHYQQTVSGAGTFHQSLPVHDNIGYYYRAFVELPDTTYYGKARHYGLEMVDLGIGTLWANMNVDASNPEDYGGYYAWGETATKDDYSLSYYDGYISRLSQYVNMGDSLCINHTSHDVAHVKMGNAWRMPTNAELTALKDRCTWTWTSLNNVNGFKVTGPSGNSIFLPAAGYKNGTSTSQLYNGCVYPSSTLGGFFNGYAYTFAGNTSQRVIQNNAFYGSIFSNSDPFAERRIGHTVRAVASPNAVTRDNVMTILTDSATWAWKGTVATLHGSLFSTQPIAEGTTIGFIVGDSPNIEKHNATVYPQEDLHYGSFTQQVEVVNQMGHWYRAYVETADTICYGVARHYGLEMVDLGLPSGTKWANMNVEASKPSDFGGFYTWGETTTKDVYTEENNSNGSATLGNNGNIQYTNHDAAYVNMGLPWCMPTQTQMSELMSQCTWKWTNESDASGWRVTGPNGNSIFLPAAGYKSYNNYRFEDKGGSYMTATQSNQTGYCYVMDFTQTQKAMYSSAPYGHIFGNYDGNALRYCGHSVRAVAVEH